VGGGGGDGHHVLRLAEEMGRGKSWWSTTFPGRGKGAILCGQPKGRRDLGEGGAVALGRIAGQEKRRLPISTGVVKNSTRKRLDAPVSGTQTRIWVGGGNDV